MCTETFTKKYTSLETAHFISSSTHQITENTKVTTKKNGKTINIKTINSNLTGKNNAHFPKGILQAKR